MTDWHMILDTWNPSNGLPGWCTAYHPDGQDPISAANSGLTGHGRLNQFAHLLTSTIVAFEILRNVDMGLRVWIR